MESLDVSYAGVAGVGWNDAKSVPVGCCGDPYYGTGTLPPSTNNYLCGQCIIGEIIARADHGRRTTKNWALHGGSLNWPWLWKHSSTFTSPARKATRLTDYFSQVKVYFAYAKKVWT